MALLGVIYPVMTLFAITITANHYLTDAIGGGLVIFFSFLTVEIGFKRRLFAREIAARVRKISMPVGPPVQPSPFEASISNPSLRFTVDPHVGV